MTKPSIFRYEGHNYLVPFLIISSLFFMWGFAHGILEVLNPHSQESFHISKAMSALTQAAVYGAYFLMALPAGWIIRKWGYRRGVITGLVLFGIGALMFIPGSRINSFYFFVLSLFVIGCGLTCLETSANPYTTVLGHPDKAESRINLSQSLNGIGWIVGPLVGGQLLFSGVNIAIPYALVGIFVLSVALVLSRIKLPDPRRAHEADTNEKVEEKPMRVMAFGFGMLTLFLYVAAQTGVNSFFINYAEESIHIEKQTASLYLAFGGMGLFFIGRLAGGVIMNYIQPRLVLLVCAILTFIATLIVVICKRNLIAHCVLRPVSGREHHVSDYLLVGIEGCGYKDKTCLFIAHHDDSGWSGCSGNHGVYCGYYWQYGDCISHTDGMLWGDWRVCCNAEMLFSWCQKRLKD